MTESQWTSIAATLMLGLLLICCRKSLRSWNCLSVFLVSHLIFVFSGVLLFPWLLPYLGESYQIGEVSNLDLFGWLHVDVFSDRDITNAIWLSIGGGVIVAFGYQAARSVMASRHRRPRQSRRPETVAPAGQLPLGFSPHWLRVLSGVVAASILVLLWSKRGGINLGLGQGFLLGRNDLVIEARFAMSEGGYLLWVLCCNVMPFFAAGEWLTYRTRKNRAFSCYPYALLALTAVGLLLLFHKRPLIVFLGALALLDYWRRSGARPSRRPWLSLLQNQRSRVLVLRIFLLVAALLVLYWASTSVGRNGESMSETIYVLLAITLTRIFGRLSIPAVFYPHYFPQVEPHYGISNIGLLTKLLGMDTFSDTSVLFQYFSDHDTGSAAIFAIMDFYGGFGWLGWLIGCMLLGVLLERLDSALQQLKPSVAKGLGKVFAFVFVYYLSQSSLPRALCGYGGVFYLACWCLLVVSDRKPRPGAVGRKHALRLPDSRSSSLAGAEKC